MNERARIAALQMRLSELLRENAELKLAAAKMEKIVLQKSVDDLTATVATLEQAMPIEVKP